MSKETGGPAFPAQATQHFEGAIKIEPHHGMTLRQYAAIKLGVPDSEIDWLDDMIRKSNRDKLAMAAMQGAIASCSKGEISVPWCYQMAQAMLEARK